MRGWTAVWLGAWLAWQVQTSVPGVCPSMDIRNSPENLRLLEDCRIIEGFLQVVLIHNATESDYDQLVFPKLREVTGFVIFFNVVGLRSLGQLFPNLSVVRGDSLFLNFALSVFNMLDLQEIALVGLTTIVRGSVAIVNNPKLCFVKTVDWDLIAKGDHYFSLRANSCPSCPKNCSTNCWNRTHCQEKEIHESKCHPQCVGGCTGPGPDQCTACKNLLTNGICTSHCEPNKFNYLNRLCVSAEDCKLMHKTLNRPGKNLPPSALKKKMWFTWNGTCVDSCPLGFKPDEKQGCSVCRGPCLRVCDGATVDSIQSAQKLEHCTHINGSLQIQIRSGDPAVIAHELEKSLGLIQQIEGQLKVIHSYPLVDLAFLKNLRIIKGNPQFSDNNGYSFIINKTYSFIIKDNQNLQELFDWKRPAKKNFQILNGRLLIHFNPKLCPHYIEELAEVAKITNITDLEVAKNSDGVNYLCNVLDINIHVALKTETSFLLVIDKPSFNNTSSDKPDWLNLGFGVYYKEAPHRNVTSQFDNDACSDDGWIINDVSPTPEKDSRGRMHATVITHLIAHLKPYTQYAFYVKTYSVGNTGGQSMIQYVRTLPSKPSIPEDIQAYSKSSSEIIVKWTPPSFPNGKLKEYVIQGTLLEFDADLPLNKDFCKYPITYSHEETVSLSNFLAQSEEENRKKKLSSDRQFICDQSATEKYSKTSLFFYDGTVPSCERGLFNVIEKTVLKPKVTLHHPKLKRSASEYLFENSSAYNPFLMDNDTVLDGSEVFNSDGTYQSFIKYINSCTNFVSLTNLKHFSSYHLEIKACREKDSQEEYTHFSRSHCSHSSTFTVRTQKAITSDSIDHKTLNVIVSNKTAQVFWAKPNEFNGLVVSYHVEFRKTDHENIKPHIHCVSGKNFALSNGYLIKGLDFGQYSVRIRAISLGGEGPFSHAISFSVVDNSYTFFKAIIIIVVSVSLIVMTLALIGAKALSHFYKKRLEKNILFRTVNPEYSSISTGYVEDEWELSREDIQLIREIKQGNFGMVYEGLLMPENRKVAVKTVIETASGRDQSEFLKEATIMKSFSNAHHVVKLLGIVSRGQPILVVMELMALGDLKSFLRSSRNSPQYPPPSTNRLTLMSAQIADGMVYLEAYKFVHRDLAARNCMVSEDLTVKIGDFGMTRDIYETDYYRKGNKGLLPIRWMAPESLNDGVFTSHSDVWSFGVVLWEMVTLANQPYQGMSNEQVLQYVISGNKLDTPVYCPPLIKDIMMNCWKWKPKMRPTFIDILDRLNLHVSEEFRTVSFYHSPEGMKARNLNDDSKKNEEQTSLLLLPNESSVEYHGTRSSS